MDEMIALFRHLWSGSREPFNGTNYGFQDGVFDPLPVQGKDVQLLIGGRSDAALKRAGKHAAFWQTTTATPEMFPECVAKIRAEQPNGASVEVGTVMAFNGNVDEARASVRTWEAAGAQHLSVNFGPPDGRVERMQQFAREFQTR
jgi:alkanesulfonate monooxygenase SsuD/methylene tetrahydromethanopterin reductase-like flavin-dependent oxidoreductase (luciferase family)